jgi:hypothetical protein
MLTQPCRPPCPISNCRHTTYDAIPQHCAQIYIYTYKNELLQQKFPDRHAKHVPTLLLSTTQALPSEWTKVTYKKGGFPRNVEAEAYGLSEEDCQEQLFLGRCIPPQPFSDQELASKGYRS